MKKGNEEKSININEYLLKKLNIYKRDKIDLEVTLNEKKERIDEFQRNINILSQAQNLDNSVEVFTPFHNLVSEHSEIDNYVKLSSSLKVECSNLEAVIENNNSEIDEISHILRGLFENQNKSDNTFNNYNILKSQEYENQRISRDLHDSVVQNLTSYIYKIELIQKLIDIDPNRCRLELELLRVNIKKSINELRNIIYNLRPMSFDDIGMNVTLENTVNQIQIDNNIKIIYNLIENCSTKLDDVDSIISISLLRIVQEACSNSIRHGLSKHIVINIIMNDTDIQMNITDDGKGFELDKVCNRDRNGKNGYGISIMKERILLLNGNIDIESQIDKGTKIMIKIPLYDKGELKFGY